MHRNFLNDFHTRIVASQHFYKVYLYMLFRKCRFDSTIRITLISLFVYNKTINWQYCCSLNHLQFPTCCPLKKSMRRIFLLVHIQIQPRPCSCEKYNSKTFGEIELTTPPRGRKFDFTKGLGVVFFPRIQCDALPTELRRPLRIMNSNTFLDS